jgi:hypothetical protein
MIVFLLAAFAALILLEVPGLIKKKLWRELTVYSVLMLLALAISVLYLEHIQIPNPVKNTQYYLKDVFEHLLGVSYD